MIERLIDFLISTGKSLLPFVVCNSYEKGLRWRLGHVYGDVEPGLVWRIPFADEIRTFHTMMRSCNMNAQSITTKDRKDFVIGLALQFYVDDPAMYMLASANDADTTTVNVVSSIVVELGQELEADILPSMLPELIHHRGNEMLAAFGIRLSHVGLTDCQKCRSLRLLQDSVGGVV